jgi:hypothetical protein
MLEECGANPRMQRENFGTPCAIADSLTGSFGGKCQYGITSQISYVSKQG